MPLRPRAAGEVRLSSKRTGGAVSTLDGLRQAGCFRALFPDHDGPGLTAMLLNTAGGVTGGDRLRLTARAGARSRLSLTTQAAERIYAASSGETGRITNSLSLDSGARLDWLPQETILFDQGVLRRALTVDMEPDATLLAVEPLILGRPAHGELLRQVALRDQIRVSRGGELIQADALRLVGDATAILSGPATGNGLGAFAALIYAAPDADAFLDPLRALLPAPSAASLIRDGLLLARLAAPDAFTLRRILIPALTLLHGHALPRSWTL
nr:urease accessory protein UreD [Frigidibacter sp. ROC022]